MIPMAVVTSRSDFEEARDTMESDVVGQGWAIGLVTNRMTLQPTRRVFSLSKLVLGTDKINTVINRRGL